MSLNKATPPSVNFHLWRPCNMSCRGCFARFEDLGIDVLPRGHLRREDALEVVRRLGERFCKITFAGGEPTLCPWLPELIEAAKGTGAATMLVTNGSRLDETYLRRVAGSLDWVALSIDSANPNTHHGLGRTLARGPIPNSRYLALAAATKDFGIRLKINTVVNALNAQEDMSGLLIGMLPERWKLLQMLPVEGQNDGTVEALLIEEQLFRTFVERHRHLEDHGIAVVPEDNTAMTGSYAMVDPAGRFFDNTTGRHTYSRPILVVGLDSAWSEIRFHIDRFVARGGVYSW